jgi:hypothetical protein
MKKETYFKELFKDRNLYFEERNIPEISMQDLKESFENDIKDYLDYLDNVTRYYKKAMQYKVNLLENDCTELRKVFILERLKDADTRNRITCLLTLFYIMQGKNIKEFLELLDNSSYFNRKSSREDTFHEVQDIRDIEELKQYVINKINK